MIKAYKKWLSDQGANVFVTVTLKKAILNDQGFWVRLNEDHVKKTAWLLRDRVTKALVGHKQKINYLSFTEGDGDLKRFHLHLAISKPKEISVEIFDENFRRTALRLDWVYNEIDIKHIHVEDNRNIISYSLKEGAGSFLPEASYFHN